jgi:DnaJ-class molecular chaperone
VIAANDNFEIEHCDYCAGTGKLTTQVSKTFQGSIYKAEAYVRKCEECDGAGATREA